MRVSVARTASGAPSGEARLAALELRCRELEQALEQSEQRLRDFAEGASDWLWETDAEQRFTHFSGRLTEVSGAKFDQYLGRTRADVLAETLTPEQRQRHLDDLAARRPFRDFDYPTRTPKGLRWFRVSGKPVFGKDGRFRGYRGTGSDITAEIEANQRAKAAHDRFAEALEVIPISLMLCDADDRIVVCNSATATNFPGFEHLLVPGTRFVDLMRARAEKGYIPEAVGRVEDWLASRMARRRNPEPGGFPQTYSDGRWMQLIERRTAEGGFITCAVDITELKDKTDALARQTALLQATLDNISQGISVVDSDLRMAAINHHFMRLLGFPETMCKVGRPFADFIRFNAERGEYGPGDVEEQVRQRVDLARKPAPHCFERARADGTVLEIRGTPMPGGGFVTTYTDITQHKRIEDELAADRERLADYSSELERSNKELEQFAYIASHDLQEPLRMVGSYCQLLQRRYGGKLDADADEFIGFAVEGATRMQRMINDLLAYSRVGRGGAAFAAVDAAGAVQSALDNLQGCIAESGARICVGALPTLAGIRPQLVQLFQNLIGNAIKFRGERAPEIHVEAERDGADWRFAVRDNGIGIAPDHAERIFLIFQRLHERAKYPGTGIGLAICKKVVEQHGGKIWVEPAPRGGSAFRFTLPAEAGTDGESA